MKTRLSSRMRLVTVDAELRVGLLGPPADAAAQPLVAARGCCQRLLRCCTRRGPVLEGGWGVSVQDETTEAELRILGLM
jgi:hypothetical protein